MAKSIFKKILSILIIIPIALIFLLLSAENSESNDDLFEVTERDKKVQDLVYGSVQSEEDFYQCISALGSVGKYIEDNRPILKSDFPHALRGALNMQSSYIVRNSPMLDRPIKASDLDVCLKFEADNQKISLLKKVIDDQLPNTPIQSLHECGAGLMVLGWIYEIQYGHDEAVKMGMTIGEEIGRTLIITKNLYRNIGENFDEVMNDIEILLDQYMKESAENKKSSLKSFFNSCTKLSIPYETYIESLPFSLRPPLGPDFPSE